MPPSLGVTIPTDSTKTGLSLGLQEERIGRDAWVGILDALVRLKAAREADTQIHTSMDMNTRE